MGVLFSPKMYQLSWVRAVQHYRMVMGLMTFKHLSVILSLDNITMRVFHLNVSYALHTAISEKVAPVIHDVSCMVHVLYHAAH